ncbi:hypothetical protein M0638_19810 [Roseomonas sp. NAR14]|uniref:Poly(3-hydroxyalkanoate) polymerase subunit PhaE n=1 Tax=Roseomonas acroporae TaxID=2937791 RepID=A0A9X1YBF4_9PROT|nr:poly(R)-hydroxyalkanoic acid synthase subunit PhaE [Roseomonas acroporae]MCK8786625.1 hypothetical protein [Roseomonas acroporae]
MENFDYGKAFTDMWALGGKAFMTAQETAMRAMRESMAAFSSAGAMAEGAAALPDLAAESGELARTSRALAELMASATSLSAMLAQRLPEGEAGSSVASGAFRRMIDPRIWLGGGDEMDQALRRLAEGPRLADLWDVERKFLRLFKSWLTLRRHGMEHNILVLEGWMRAGRAFNERLAALSAKGEAPDGQRAMLDLWVEVANRSLLQMQHSEAYLKSQAQLLKSSTELRVVQRELAEYYGDLYGFPTRTEIDDVHRTVTELRREVRQLRRQLRDGGSAVAAAPAESPAERPAPPSASRRAAPSRGPKAIEAPAAVSVPALSEPAEPAPAAADTAAGGTARRGGRAGVGRRARKEG